MSLRGAFLPEAISCKHVVIAPRRGGFVPPSPASMPRGIEGGVKQSPVEFRVAFYVLRFKSFPLVSFAKHAKRLCPSCLVFSSEYDPKYYFCKSSISSSFPNSTQITRPLRPPPV